MNTIAIIGRLTADYEVKHTPQGKPIGNFSIAVNDGWGENEHVSYFNIAVFGKFAEEHGKHIKKGSKVGIEGCIRQERWEKDGQKKSAVKIIANRIEYLDSKPKSESNDDWTEPF